MVLVDTHAHIYTEEFDSDRDALLERAEKESVTKILLPAVDSESHDRLVQLADAHAQCLPMMGLHPCSVKENYRDELEVVNGWFQRRRFIAVGETGLDFYWDKTFTEQQYAAFRQQVEWSLQYEIPVVIHSRNATDECIDVIREFQPQGVRGVFHCFSGTEAQARTIMELGFYLGIGGVLTFKNAGLDKVVKAVGLEQVVLETDAPYLAPVPFRGKRNEPSYLRYILEKLVEITGLSQEDIAQKTSKNAQKLFGC